VLRPLYEKWFRVETIGLHNVPVRRRRARGGQPLRHAAARRADDRRSRCTTTTRAAALRLLGADLVFDLPVIGRCRARWRHAGLQRGRRAAAHRGELVGVFPEGFKGIGKPFRERYKLQRFGRGGFVTRRCAPGADHPVRDRRRRGDLPEDRRTQDARPGCSGLPVLPGHADVPAARPARLVPLPSKWLIAFGEPIRTDTSGAAGRRPDDGLQPHRPGARDHPAHALPASCHSAETRSSARGAVSASWRFTYAHDIDITVRVNGRAVRAVVQPRTTLLDWLREEVGLTGTKKGCNEGACGTCTVLVDGSA
jgi:hypothetical protein